MRGKTIKLYFPDGNPRSAKIFNFEHSIVKGIYVPRTKLSEFSTLDALQRPGIYFLVGESEDQLKPQVYIGETEIIAKRLADHNHDSKKDFYSKAICFISDKSGGNGNLNRAHIQYLESEAYDLAIAAGKFKVENIKIPKKPNLIDSDKDLALGVFDDIKDLLLTLGYPILEKTIRKKSNTFECKGKGALGIGIFGEDESVTVLKGSTAVLDLVPSASNWIVNTQKELIRNGIIVEKKGLYEFEENYTFKKPSGASMIVLGRSSNGRTERKKGGKTLDEIYRT